MLGGENMNYLQFIEDNTISCEAGYRGGSIKIDVSELFPKIENAFIGAYQNYLGGGLLGAVVGGASFDPSELSKKNQKIFFELKEVIKRYFHGLTNHVGDEWEETSYKKNQNFPVSAY